MQPGLICRRGNTCNLAYDGLRDPPIVQERFDLLLHQVAVSPAKKRKKRETNKLIKLMEEKKKNEPLVQAPAFAPTNLAH